VPEPRADQERTRSGPTDDPVGHSRRERQASNGDRGAEQAPTADHVDSINLNPSNCRSLAATLSVNSSPCLRTKTSPGAAGTSLSTICISSVPRRANKPLETASGAWRNALIARALVGTETSRISCVPRAALLEQKARTVAPWLQQASRRLRHPALAGLRRLRSGRYMPVGDTVTAGCTAQRRSRRVRAAACR
jgi:hypothetical protein